MIWCLFLAVRLMLAWVRLDIRLCGREGHWLPTSPPSSSSLFSWRVGRVELWLMLYCITLGSSLPSMLLSAALWLTVMMVEFGATGVTREVLVPTPLPLASLTPLVLSLVRLERALETALPVLARLWFDLLFSMSGIGAEKWPLSSPTPA